MTIGNICNQEVITVDRDTTVLEAAKLMREHHVGDVIVTEKIRNKVFPVGIVTDRDVVMQVIAPELDCKVFTVGDITVTKIVVVKDDEGILDAINLMSSKGVRRLPVVNNENSLVGIITIDDLLLLLAKELGQLGKLIAREQKNETSRRR